jgi:hypothetical protein
MPLNTRKPTGAVPWPLVLIEGPEKSGKSYACAVLSASEKVGRSLWLDLNEGAADEYGAVPGARYEVIEHDGSWASILTQVAAAKEEASRAAGNGEPPVVLIIDSVTAEWDLLKDWASARAAKSDANKRKLQQDPGAEIKVSMNLWNDATARHRRLMTLLMTFPGIVVMTARGKYVASLDANGRPIEGTKEYKVEGHKTLAYDASVWVRLSRDTPPVVVGARSVHAGIRPGVDDPQEAKNFSLEWLIFDALKCDPSKAHARDLVQPKAERTPEQIRDEALMPGTTYDRCRELYREALDAGCGGVTWPESDETLADLLARIGAGRKPEPAKAQPAKPPAAAKAAAAQPALEPEDAWATAIESIGGPEDGEAAKADLRQQLTNKSITRERFNQVMAAIDSHVASLQGVSS